MKSNVASKRKDWQSEAEQKPLVILLIEDSLSDAKLFELSLAKAEDADVFWIVHVKRLSKALKMLQRDQFDVVVLDLGLPDSFGLDSLKAIRDLNPQLPVVVLTGSEDPQISTEALLEGAQDFLKKGIQNGDDLSRTLRHAAERQKYRDNLHISFNPQPADYSDPQTLPGIVRFAERLKFGVTQAAFSKKNLAVLLIEMKAVHPTLEAAPEITIHLQNILVQRFEETLRQTDYAAYIDGNLFGIILQDMQEKSDASVAAERLLEMAAIPIFLGEDRIDLAISIGISIYPTDSKLVEPLVMAADVALSQAKAQAETSKDPEQAFAFYDHNLNAEVHRAQILKEEILDQVHHGNVKIFYQPRFDIITDQMVKIEAHLDALTTADSERARLASQINRWLFENLCDQLRIWKQKSYTVPGVVLVLTSSHFADSDFCDFIEKTLREKNMSPSEISIEWVSSDHATNPAGRNLMLKQLKYLGIETTILDSATTMNPPVKPKFYSSKTLDSQEMEKLLWRRSAHNPLRFLL
jgi:diguanylate cyclase (GGDEF)-like protein